MKRRILSILIISLLFMMPVHAEEETNVEDIKKAGSYKVTIESTNQYGEPIHETFMLLVTYPNTVVNKGVQEAIDGHAFRLVNQKVENLTKDEMIEKAGARAWNLLSGGVIPITSVTHEEISPSRYYITYKTSAGTTLIVEAFEVKQDFLELKETYIRPSEYRILNLKNFTNAIMVLMLIPILLVLILILKSRREVEDFQNLLYSAISKNNLLNEEQDNKK